MHNINLSECIQKAVIAIDWAEPGQLERTAHQPPVCSNRRLSALQDPEWYQPVLMELKPWLLISGTWFFTRISAFHNLHPISDVACPCPITTHATSRHSGDIFLYQTYARSSDGLESSHKNVCFVGGRGGKAAWARTVSKLKGRNDK